jgi:hypothetical protein
MIEHAEAMRSRGIGTEETDRLKNAKDGSAWDFPENWGDDESGLGLGILSVGRLVVLSYLTYRWWLKKYNVRMHKITGLLFYTSTRYEMRLQMFDL